jgi:hypothetical protein
MTLFTKLNRPRRKPKDDTPRAPEAKCPLCPHPPSEHNSFGCCHIPDVLWEVCTCLVPREEIEDDA